jgi:hypothetical protein
MLAPSVMLLRFTRSLALKLFVCTLVLTQIAGIPIFVLDREDYGDAGWNAVKNFRFTAPEFIEIYMVVGLFLALTAIFCGLYELLWGLPRRPAATGLPLASKPRRNTLAIAALIAIVLPLNLWMFRNGIGLVGIEPPQLPFRLSGILVYLTRYLVPLVLFILYARSSRKLVPTCLILVYGVLLGASQVSRSTAVIALFSVLFCALVERRWWLFGLSVVWAMCATVAVSFLRTVVFFVTGGVSAADVELGLWDRMQALSEAEVPLNVLFGSIVSIIGRVESPQSVVLGYQFDADRAGGMIPMWLRFVWRGLSPQDIDAYHQESIGMMLPEGFVSTGGFLSNMLEITSGNVLLILVFAGLVGFYVYVGERLARAVGRKYSMRAASDCATLLFIGLLLVGVGTSVFWAYVLALIAILCLPKFGLGFFGHLVFGKGRDGPVIALPKPVVARSPVEPTK